MSAVSHDMDPTTHYNQNSQSRINGPVQTWMQWFLSEKNVTNIASVINRDYRYTFTKMSSYAKRVVESASQSGRQDSLQQLILSNPRQGMKQINVSFIKAMNAALQKSRPPAPSISAPVLDSRPSFTTLDSLSPSENGATNLASVHPSMYDYQSDNTRLPPSLQRSVPQQSAVAQRHTVVQNPLKLRYDSQNMSQPVAPRHVELSDDEMSTPIVSQEKTKDNTNDTSTLITEEYSSPITFYDDTEERENQTSQLRTTVYHDEFDKVSMSTNISTTGTDLEYDESTIDSRIEKVVHSECTDFASNTVAVPNEESTKIYETASKPTQHIQKPVESEKPVSDIVKTVTLSSRDHPPQDNNKIVFESDNSVNKLRLLKASFSCATHNVTSSNNCFYFAEDDMPMYTIAIQPGCYTIDNICMTLEKSMNKSSINGNRYTVSVDDVAQRILVSQVQIPNKRNASFSLLFEQTPRSMYAILGFEQVNMHRQTSYTTVKHWQLLSLTFVSIHTVDSTQSDCHLSDLLPIPTEESETVCMSRDPSQVVTIDSTTVEFTFCDKHGTVIDINDSSDIEYSLTIAYDILQNEEMAFVEEDIKIVKTLPSVEMS